MSLFVGLAIVAALIAGLARGGSLDSLAQTKFRWGVLLVEGLLIQLAFDLWDPPGLTRSGAVIVLIASNAAVAGFVLLNRRHPGMFLVAAGLLLNVVVIAANEAMPVSSAAARSAGVAAPPETSPDLKHEQLDEDTSLGFLGDVIPIPGLKEVLSLGDVVLGLGVGRLVYARTRGVRRAEKPSAASG